MSDDTAATLQEGVAAIHGEGSPVQLLMTLAAPTDEVLLAIVSAHSAEVVAAVCRRAAGIPAERLTKADDARVTG